MDDKLGGYIDSLEQSEKFTREKWIDIISKEARDLECEMSDRDIEYVMERLEEDGYVKEEA